MWERGPFTTLRAFACLVSFVFRRSRLLPFQVCTPGCPGGSSPLLPGVAFGVPRVPRGYIVAPSVSQSSVEPVSVDIIYLHPSIHESIDISTHGLALLLRCSAVAQLRQCTGARVESAGSAGSQSSPLLPELLQARSALHPARRERPRSSCAPLSDFRAFFARPPTPVLLDFS